MADKEDQSLGISFSKVVEGVWPQERDYLSRPGRLKYVRKLVHAKGCVFCDAEKVGVQFSSLCLYQGKHSMVIMNKYPYNTGHLLILPRKHCGSLLEISEEEYLEQSLLLKETVRIVTEAYGCSGVNVGLNHGKVAGAGIPDHIHWHVIPRWQGDTNFFPLIAETKVLSESLDQCYDRLKPFFQELSS